MCEIRDTASPPSHVHAGAGNGAGGAAGGVGVVLREFGTYRRRDGSSCSIMPAHARSGHAWWSDDGVYFDAVGRAVDAYALDIVAEMGSDADAEWMRGQSDRIPSRYTPAYDAPQTFAEAWRVFDACVAIALDPAEPPVPIAGTEAWVEGDREYRARLSVYGVLWSGASGEYLDALGDDLGLPRARLAKAEG